MKIFQYQFSGRPKIVAAAMQVSSRLAVNKREQMANAQRHLRLSNNLLGRVGLLLFPEMSICGSFEPNLTKPPGAQDSRRLVAETLDGAICQLFQEAARNSSTWIGFGLYTKTNKGTENTYVIATGNPATSFVMYAHRDRFLFFQRGELNTWATICSNATTTEFYQKIVDRRPDLVIVPLDAGSGLQHPHNWKTNLLTINYAGETAGASTFHFYDRGHLNVERLGAEEAALVIQI